jgi:hypothetical protein
MECLLSGDCVKLDRAEDAGFGVAEVTKLLDLKLP